jgi:hypothetical protein
MNAKALLFAIMGCIVAAFYGLESFLMFQATGFSGPLLAKVVICGLGVYICVRNVTRIKKSKPIDAPDQAI